MLRKIANFVRGFVFGLVIGGLAGVLMAPASGEETQFVLDARIRAARAAFEQERTQAEEELLAYFEHAKHPPTAE